MSKRQEIVTAASQLFREKGYHATTVRDIAKEMGLRASSLYSHFDAKEEILWEIVSTAADTFKDSAEAVDDSLEVLERLEKLIEGHFKVINSELHNATVFFHEWKFLPPELKQDMIARRDAYEAHFQSVIQQGKDEGVFQIEDVKVATLFVMSALNWSYHWMKSDGPLALSEITQYYKVLIMNSLNIKH